MSKAVTMLCDFDHYGSFSLLGMCTIQTRHTNKGSLTRYSLVYVSNREHASVVTDESSNRRTVF